jgi:hypothetical protein
MGHFRRLRITIVQPAVGFSGIKLQFSTIAKVEVIIDYPVLRHADSDTVKRVGRGTQTSFVDFRTF